VTHRFLLVRLGSLGDVIHAIPAAAALRARFPESRIDWMVDPRYVPLLEMVRGIDSRIAVNTRQLARTTSTIGDLRRVGYTAAIDLQGLLKSAILARAVHAERTIGFARQHLRERTAGLFYTHHVDPPVPQHVIFKNLALLEPLGSRDTRVSFPLEIPHSETVATVLGRFAGSPYAIVNPGAAWPNKRWPANRFGGLAAALSQRFGLRSLVLWGPGEEALAQGVVDAANGAAEAAPPTSITDLFGLARRARVMISGDTGPLHIGGAVGTPLVALFGPTYADRNGPWSAGDVVIARTNACSCLYRRRCRRNVACIDEIELPEVIEAVERRLIPPPRAEA
jgi:lipopolysaccharide heptosyltransferase I